jgi:hypothetical protein
MKWAQLWRDRGQFLLQSRCGLSLSAHRKGGSFSPALNPISLNANPQINGFSGSALANGQGDSFMNRKGSAGKLHSSLL